MKIVTEAEFNLIKNAKKNSERLKKIKQLNKDLAELLKNIVQESNEGKK